ncbi:Copine-3 [Seminavis robusta]|uniref:Copine-3 n=1 Tax=Seminavis robusta TaxID=568900 RepID=A0A9N8H834_9STRA|nr:Copine-3 [Seminavis robusta]|eukprot:Sro203_g085600.1 Copine-3 (2501) ;mRNA; r:48899-57160
MPRVHESAKLHLTLRGVGLTNVNKGWFGTSSPAFKISAMAIGASELWAAVETSERIDQNLDPEWPAITVGCEELCGGDTDRPIQIVVFDQDSKGNDIGSMGAFETSVSALLRKKVDDLNNVDVSKLFTLEEPGKGAVGKVVVMDAKIEEPPKETLKRGVASIKMMTKFKNLTELPPTPPDDDKELDKGPRLEFKLRGINIEPISKGMLRGSGANPMYKLLAFKMGSADPFEVVFESETIDNDLNPKWLQSSVSMEELCGGNKDLPIMVSVYDKEPTKETLIGTCETTVSDLVRKKVGETDSVDASMIFKLKDGGQDKGMLVVVEAQVLDAGGNPALSPVPPRSGAKKVEAPPKDDGKSRDKSPPKDDRKSSSRKDESPPKDDKKSSRKDESPPRDRKSSSKDESPPKDDRRGKSGKNSSSKSLNENSLLHLSLEGVDLANVEGWFGTSDPFFQIEALMKGFDGTTLWQNIARSEHIEENLNPKWEPVAVNIDLLCQLDLDKPIRIKFFDWEESGRHNPMGHFETTVNKLLGAIADEKGSSWDLSKAFIPKDEEGEEYGNIVVADAYIETPEVKSSRGKKSQQQSVSVDESSVLSLTLEGVDMANVEGWFGMSDPMYQIETPMKGPDGNVIWQMVHRSEYIEDSLNPRWDPADISVNLLCQLDLDKPIRFCLYDWEESGVHVTMGHFETSVNRLLRSKSEKRDGKWDLSKAFITKADDGEEFGKIVVVDVSVKGSSGKRSKSKDKGKQDSPPEVKVDDKSALVLTLEGVDMANVEGWFGTSDPMFAVEIPVNSIDGTTKWHKFYESEHVPENLNPQWEPAMLAMAPLCQCDLDKPIRISFMDWEEDECHNPMGYFVTSVNRLLYSKAEKNKDGEWDTSKALITRSDDGQEFGKIIVVDCKIDPNGYEAAMAAMLKPKKAAKKTREKSPVRSPKKEPKSPVRSPKKEPKSPTKATKEVEPPFARKEKRPFVDDKGATLFLTLEGVALANVEGWFGCSDPMYTFATKVEGSSEWETVFTSEHLDDTLDPKWEQASVNVSRLCGGDLDMPIQLGVCDWEESGEHNPMGSVIVTVQALLDAARDGDKFTVVEAGQDFGTILIRGARNAPTAVLAIRGARTVTGPKAAGVSQIPRADSLTKGQGVHTTAVVLAQGGHTTAVVLVQGVQTTAEGPALSAHTIAVGPALSVHTVAVGPALSVHTAVIQGVHLMTGQGVLGRTRHVHMTAPQSDHSTTVPLGVQTTSREAQGQLMTTCPSVAARAGVTPEGVTVSGQGTAPPRGDLLFLMLRHFLTLMAPRSHWRAMEVRDPTTANVQTCPVLAGPMIAEKGSLQTLEGRGTLGLSGRGPVLHLHLRGAPLGAKGPTAPLVPLTTAAALALHVPLTTAAVRAPFRGPGQDLGQGPVPGHAPMTAGAEGLTALAHSTAEAHARGPDQDQDPVGQGHVRLTVGVEDRTVVAPAAHLTAGVAGDPAPFLGLGRQGTADAHQGQAPGRDLIVQGGQTTAGVRGAGRGAGRVPGVVALMEVMAASSWAPGKVCRIKQKPRKSPTAQPWTPVYTSEAIEGELEPSWKPASMGVDLLCDGNLDKRILVSVLDQNDKKAGHAPMGSFETTVNKLIEAKVGGFGSGDNFDDANSIPLMEGNKEVGRIVVLGAHADAPKVKPIVLDEAKPRESSGRRYSNSSRGSRRSYSSRRSKSSRSWSSYGSRSRSRSRSRSSRGSSRRSYSSGSRFSDASSRRKKKSDDESGSSVVSDSESEADAAAQDTSGFHEDAALHLSLCGTELANVEGFFGMSDPFVEIASYTGLPPPSMWQPIFQSEHIENNLNPRWKPLEMNLEMLCKRDLDQPIQVKILDWEENGKHQPMGSFQTTVNGLMEAKVYFDDDDQIDTSKAFTVMQNGEVYGKIVVSGARIENPEPVVAPTAPNAAGDDEKKKGSSKKKKGKQKRQHQIKFNTHGDELSIGTIESSDEAKVQQMLEEPKTNVFGEENNEDDGKSRPWKSALPQTIGLDAFTNEIGDFQLGEDGENDDDSKEGSLTDIAALLAKAEEVEISDSEDSDEDEESEGDDDGDDSDNESDDEDGTDKEDEEEAMLEMMSSMQQSLSHMAETPSNATANMEVDLEKFDDMYDQVVVDPKVVSEFERKLEERARRRNKTEDENLDPDLLRDTPRLILFESEKDSKKKKRGRKKKNGGSKFSKEFIDAMREVFGDSDDESEESDDEDQGEEKKEDEEAMLRNAGVLNKRASESSLFLGARKKPKRKKPKIDPAEVFAEEMRRQEGVKILSTSGLKQEMADMKKGLTRKMMERELENLRKGTAKKYSPFDNNDKNKANQKPGLFDDYNAGGKPYAQGGAATAAAEKKPKAKAGNTGLAGHFSNSKNDDLADNRLDDLATVALGAGGNEALPPLPGLPSLNALPAKVQQAGNKAKNTLGAISETAAGPLRAAGEQTFFSNQQAWDDDESQANVGLTNNSKPDAGKAAIPKGQSTRKFKAPQFNFGKRKGSGVQLDDDEDY